MRGKYRLWEILKLARWLHTHRCDLLHVHRMGGVTFPALVAGMIVGVKSMVIHHHFPYSWENPRKRILESFITRTADKLVGVSEHVLYNSVRRLNLSPNKVRRIYNGAALDKILHQDKARETLRIPQNRLICGLVARIVYFKRIQDALEAMAILRKKRRGVKLALVGGGEPKRMVSFRKKAETMSIESSVVWCGEVQNAAALMRAFNLGMLVSTKEGLGNTVLEYWMAGLPLVATEIPPIKEMVSAGGILVPPRSPGKIAKAIEAIASSPRLGGRLSREGKRRVKRFSVENTAETTASLYDSLSTP